MSVAPGANDANPAGEAGLVFMALSMNTPIQANDIDSIEALAPGHPVFQLYGKNDDSIVIKAEKDESKSLAQHASVLAVVDRNALHKVLDANERQELRRWVSRTNATDTATRDALNELNQVLLFDLHYAQRKVQYGTQQGSAVKAQILFKMEPRAGLTDLKKANAKIRNAQGTKDKTDVRLIAKGLNAAGGLEKLGQILVADYFNGSEDRFSSPFEDLYNKNALTLQGGAYDDYEGQNLKIRRFKVIQNHGNVFVFMAGNKPVPIGLDFFDYKSAFRDYSVDDDNVFDAWPGKWLKDDQVQVRRQIAEAVVDDLNAVLGPRDRTFSIARTARLKSNAANRFAAGMERGIELLKKGWELRKQNGPRPQPGLQKRIDILGW